MSLITVSLFFGGLAASVIPILLHLLTRSKPRRMPFPALRFVRATAISNQRRFRLKSLLLLMLRVILLLVLGLALSRPILRGMGSPGIRAGGGSSGPVACVLVVDTTLGMGYRQANETRLEAAIRCARTLISRLPKGSQVAILDSGGSSDSFQVDQLAAIQRLESLIPAAAGRPLTDSILAGLRLLGTSSLPSREIHVFTDRRTRSWPSSVKDAIRSAVRQVSDTGPESGGGLTSRLWDVSVPERENTTVASSGLLTELVAADVPLRFDVELRHEGQEKEVLVELLWDQEEKEHADETQTAAATATVRFPAGSAVRSLVLQTEGLPPGVHQGRIRLAADDPLSEDNIRYFTVQAGETWPVLLVGSRPAEQSTLFFREAISPEEYRQSGRASFVTQVIDEEALEALSEENLSAFSAILLFDPHARSPELVSRLSEYVSAGGGLGVFPGRNATPVTAFQTPEWQTLLGGKLTTQVRVPDWNVALVPTSDDNAILASFHAFPQGSVPWNEMTVCRYWQLTEISDRAGSVLNYTDGRPALLIQALGRGTVVTGTGPFSDGPHRDAWNYFTTNNASWLYLVLADSITRALSAGSIAPLNYHIGEQAVLRPRSDTFPETVILTLPDGARVPLQTDPSLQEIRFGGTNRMGSYRIRSSEESGSLSCGFSVNAVAEEYDSSVTSREDITTFWPEGESTWLDAGSSFSRTGSPGKTGRELLPTLAFFLGLLLATECLLSSRYYSPQH